MAIRRVICTAFLTCVCVSWARGQDVAPIPSPSRAQSPSEVISLAVPRGTTLQVALDKEVKVNQVGQPIHGRVMEPVYAFDRQVIPAGSEVVGRITEIASVPGKKRTLAALNAEFTPAHKIQVEFNELVLADGKHIPISTVVARGSGQVIQFVTADENDKKKTVKDAASKKLKEAKEEAKRKWHTAMQQVKEPGKLHRLVRFGVGQLPVHPQYIDAGTLYFAELQEPLDFGNVPLAPQTAAWIGTPPPPGSLVHALLMTPLSSAITQKGAPVEAVLSQPLFSEDHLIFPQGSRLQGSVVQVQPARRLGRNGQLRIAFHELVLPDGIQQKVDASLVGVQAGEGEHVTLDSEGGAQATSSKRRYLSTGLAVALAAMSSDGNESEGGVTSASGDAGAGAAGGGAGFKLIGIAVGAFVHSQPLGMAMGVYGASRSVYSHFLARGRDVVFSEGTAMEIGFGSRGVVPTTPKPDKSS